MNRYDPRGSRQIGPQGTICQEPILLPQISSKLGSEQLHITDEDKEGFFLQRAAGGSKPTIMRLSSSERAVAAAAPERVKRA